MTILNSAISIFSVSVSLSDPNMSIKRQRLSKCIKQHNIKQHCHFTYWEGNVENNIITHKEIKNSSIKFRQESYEDSINQGYWCHEIIINVSVI